MNSTTEHKHETNDDTHLHNILVKFQKEVVMDEDTKCYTALFLSNYFQPEKKLTKLFSHNHVWIISSINLSRVRT